jgi:hypothetical protein
MSNNNSTKDEPLDMNGDPKTPTSNMAPPLSSMLQMTNSLQSSNSPYNPPNNQGSKQSLNSPNLGHMSKQMDHMNLPPQHMQFQVCFLLFRNDFKFFFFSLEYEPSPSYVRSTRFNAPTF